MLYAGPSQRWLKYFEIVPNGSIPNGNVCDAKKALSIALNSVFTKVDESTIECKIGKCKPIFITTEIGEYGERITMLSKNTIPLEILREAYRVQKGGKIKIESGDVCSLTWALDVQYGYTKNYVTKEDCQW